MKCHEEEKNDTEEQVLENSFVGDVVKKSPFRFAQIFPKILLGIAIFISSYMFLCMPIYVILLFTIGNFMINVIGLKEGGEIFDAVLNIPLITILPFFLIKFIVKILKDAKIN